MSRGMARMSLMKRRYAEGGRFFFFSSFPISHLPGSPGHGFAIITIETPAHFAFQPPLFVCPISISICISPRTSHNLEPRICSRHPRPAPRPRFVHDDRIVVKSTIFSMRTTARCYYVVQYPLVVRCKENGGKGYGSSIRLV